MAHYSIRFLECGRKTDTDAGHWFNNMMRSGELDYTPFGFTVLQGEGHTILFDCGFDMDDPYYINEEKIEGNESCTSVDEVLRINGIDPSKVDTVIISHLHWDHAGGVTRLPNAVFYVQKEELEGWEAALGDPLIPYHYKNVVPPDTIAAIRKLAEEGRCVLLDGEKEDFLPGISLRTAKGHSILNMMAFLDTDCGKYAVIGDIAGRHECLTGTEELPFFLPDTGFCLGTIREICAGYQKVLDYVENDIERVILTHDVTRFDISPTKINELGLANVTICE